MLKYLSVSAPPEVLKALIHALSPPSSANTSPPRYLETLHLGFTGFRDRESSVPQTHTSRKGRQIGSLLVRALETRFDHGYPQLCNLVVDSCMALSRLRDFADDVQVKNCDCSPGN